MEKIRKSRLPSVLTAQTASPYVRFFQCIKRDSTSGSPLMENIMTGMPTIRTYRSQQATFNRTVCDKKAYMLTISHLIHDKSVKKSRTNQWIQLITYLLLFNLILPDQNVKKGTRQNNIR